MAAYPGHGKSSMSVQFKIIFPLSPTIIRSNPTFREVKSPELKSHSEEKRHDNGCSNTSQQPGLLSSKTLRPQLTIELGRSHQALNQHHSTNQLRTILRAVWWLSHLGPWNMSCLFWMVSQKWLSMRKMRKWKSLLGLPHWEATNHTLQIAKIRQYASILQPNEGGKTHETDSCYLILAYSYHKKETGFPPEFPSIFHMTDPHSGPCHSWTLPSSQAPVPPAPSHLGPWHVRDVTTYSN